MDGVWGFSTLNSYDCLVFSTPSWTIHLKDISSIWAIAYALDDSVDGGLELIQLTLSIVVV